MLLALGGALRMRVSRSTCARSSLGRHPGHVILGLFDFGDRPGGLVSSTDELPTEQRTLVDSVRFDMRRYGARLVRAELAGGALLTAALAVVVLAAVVTRRPMAPVGQLLLLGLGVFFAGGTLNCLTLLVIACRHGAGSTTPDDPDLTHHAILRLIGFLLIPGSLPLVALRQGRRRARRPSPSARRARR